MNAEYRFGGFELNPTARQLLADGRPIVLGEPAFDVLVALVEQRRRLVTIDELLEVASPWGLVGKDKLQEQIGDLRRALGAQAIVTVPERGYRFALRLEGDPVPRSDQSAESGDRRTERRPWLVPPLFGGPRLAAVVFTDVVGYSARMQHDELGTIVLVKADFERMAELCARHGGELLNRMGDGLLLCFPSALQAVSYALHLQTEFGERKTTSPSERALEHRIGVHIGDVFRLESGDVAGDGINIASRLESKAPPGGICMSQMVYDTVRGKLPMRARFAGPESLKNITEPVQIWHVMPVDAAKSATDVLTGDAPTTDAGTPTARGAATVSDKSIAVLPFENLSADAENAYFVEGMQIEILTALSKIRDLKVIARESTTAYRGAKVDVRQCARTLGVAHVLGGSVRRAGNRARINVHLVRAEADTQLWAETYDRQLDDVFSVQSEVAEKVVESLGARLSRSEQRALATRPTDSTSAYDAYLHGLIAHHQAGYRRETLRQAAECFAQAVTFDPNFALAWAHCSLAEMWLYHFGYERTQQMLERARASAETALKLQPELGEAHVAFALYRYQGLNDYGGALHSLEEAQRRLPNNASVLSTIAYVERRLGHFDSAISRLEAAIELDPKNQHLVFELASTQQCLRRFDDSLTTVDRIPRLQAATALLAVKAMANLALGDLQKAAEVLERMEIRPNDFLPFKAQVRQWLLERRYDVVINVLQSALATPDLEVAFFQLVLYHYFLGFAQQLSGVPDAARATYTQGRNAFESRFSAKSVILDRPWELAAISLIHAGLGDKATALHYADRAMALAGRDHLDGPGVEEVLARIHAQFGDADAAVGLLAPLLHKPYMSMIRQVPVTSALLRLEPDWDLIRAQPRFQRLTQDG